MTTFSVKEKAFIERVREEKIDITKLVKRLKLLIKISEISAVTIFALMLIILFFIGETPKLYHVLILLSVFLLVFVQYLNWRNTLTFIQKNRALLMFRDEN